MTRTFEPCICGNKNTFTVNEIQTSKNPDVYMFSVMCYDCENTPDDLSKTLESAIERWNSYINDIKDNKL